MIKSINKDGKSVLLVKRNVYLVLEVADRGYALQVGQVALSADIETMRTSELIRRACLGGNAFDMRCSWFIKDARN